VHNNTRKNGLTKALLRDTFKIMDTEEYILLRDHLWNLRYDYMKDRKSSDGLSSHVLYSTWIGMLNRCYNPNDYETEKGT
jgi:hypothetical protein